MIEIPYVVRNLATGEVKKIGNCADILLHEQAGDGEVAEIRPSYVTDRHYYNGAEYVERLAMPITHTGDVAINQIFRADGIPAGTTVHWSGGAQLINDGFFEWASKVACNEIFFLLNPIYLDFSIYVSVTDP